VNIKLLSNYLNGFIKLDTLTAENNYSPEKTGSMLNFDAVIFDLDGVITKTALVHGSAWKKMFDEYLRSREERFGEPFKEFTHADDYLPYVDGKPRYKGVASFLESRGIDIPFGDPSDDPDEETVCGLGNRKNILFNRVLDEEGVQVYETTVELIHALREADIRIGVASSSKNCKPVLEAADLLKYMETRVDGVVSAELGLHGKPEPDIFTTACDNLGVEYHRAVVVEDAVSGVQAGKNGNFGLVIGVAREENVRELQVAGGDIVVEDLGEITMEVLRRWFDAGLTEKSWHLDYFDYNTEMEKSREALLAVGNGYFGTRGSLEESAANAVNYPGTYVSGLFNRRISRVGDRDIENEDFVNITNWTRFRFRVDQGPWFSFDPDPAMKITRIHRRLNMREGTLTREMILTDETGRETMVRSIRFAGMHDPHLAGARYAVVPLNYSGTIEIESSLTGNHINAGVERYSDLNQDHLVPVTENTGDDVLQLVVKTNQSDIQIAMAAKHSVSGADLNRVKKVQFSDKAVVGARFSATVSEGNEIGVEKMVTIYTSMNGDSDDPAKDTVSRLKEAGNFREELKQSSVAWKDLWKEMDIRIQGDRAAQNLVRLHLYHMMVTASPHHATLDAGIPPRGLHGEAYRGHIFWDELYILPLYNIHFPEVTRSSLMYRYRRLDAARAYAKEYGYEGAMFPWQSGSDGREETQVVHLNPLSGEWGDDYSSLQRHISIAVAYNTWNYFLSSGDTEFMEAYGAELFLDICRFWTSKTAFDAQDGRYHIDRVMGPDEFHEKLPGSNEGGVRDNAYTNVMVSWLLSRIPVLKEKISEKAFNDVIQTIGVDLSMLEHWEDIRVRLSLNINEEGIIEQFSGYFDLEELDWEYYKKKYDDIHRMDRILKAEGKSPDAYKVSKQADLLMLFYTLGFDDVLRTIRGMGYEVPEDYFDKNFHYYIERTSHGSTLSRLVHARLAIQSGLEDIGMRLYRDALESDLVDIQGGTTGEGIHCGVMAGTVFDALVSFAGLNIFSEQPALCPALPEGWHTMAFKFSFRGIRYDVEMTRDAIKIVPVHRDKTKIKLHICGEEIDSESGDSIVINLKK
jgi:beta-phosphoglucomutase family hydrolase